MNVVSTFLFCFTYIKGFFKNVKLFVMCQIFIDRFDIIISYNHMHIFLYIFNEEKVLI